MSPLRHQHIEQVFNGLFSDSHATVVRGGAEEPLYRPASASQRHHQILYRADYGASALHEIAHWCVAGESRRLLEDYGYWYAPDGRNEAQQRAFEQVEVKPQAMEWIMAVACGRQFRVSADNLDAELGPSEGFKQAIVDQALSYCRSGLPSRLRALCEGFSRQSGIDDYLAESHYSRAQL